MPRLVYNKVLCSTCLEAMRQLGLRVVKHGDRLLISKDNSKAAKLAAEKRAAREAQHARRIATLRYSMRAGVPMGARQAAAAFHVSVSTAYELIKEAKGA